MGRWLRVLTALFPAAFRRALGDDLRQALIDRYHDVAPRGGGSRLAFCLRCTGQVLRDAFLEWLPGRGEPIHGAAPGGHRPSSPRSSSLMDTLVQDLQYALRSLRRAPGFTVVVALTLGLGVGANVAVFSIVDGVLLSSLPVPEPERLVMVWEYDVEQGPTRSTVSPADYRDLREELAGTLELAAYTGWNPTLVHGTAAEKVEGARVTAAMLELLGAVPVEGRRLDADDMAPGAPPVVVLTGSLGQALWPGEERLVGRRLDLDGTVHEVVGVLADGFTMPMVSEARFWAPLAVDPGNRGGHFLRVVGRLEPGVDLASAGRAADVVGTRLAEAYPGSNAGTSFWVRPLHEDVVGGVRQPLWILMGTVAFVLLIGALNVANLAVARGSTRSGELAVRAALGASRRRLLAQLLTEGLVLAALGGTLGVVMARAGLGVILGMVPADLPRLDAVALDLRVLGFAVVVTALTGVVAGILPALRGAGTGVAPALRSGGRGSTEVGGLALRRGLVVAEVALALVLLVGAGLLMRSFGRLVGQEPGFRTDLLAARIDLGDDYPDAAAHERFYTDLRNRLTARPDVTDVALAFQPPFGGYTMLASLAINGPEDDDSPIVRVTAVDPSFFEVLGIPLLRGRAFGEEDGPAGQPVAIVNRTLAAGSWPDDDPLGDRVTVGISLSGEPEPERLVVGVVADARYGALDREPRPQVYVPYRQYPTARMEILVRGAGDRVALARALRDEVAGLDPRVAVTRISGLDDLVGQSVAEERFTSLTSALFAAVALALGAVGVSGVMAYSVTRRTREIGVRVALGARSADVVGMVLREALVMVGVGVAVGLAAALALGRFLTGLLHEVEATDPTTLAVTAMVVVGTALLASWAPARRATRVDPVRVLRS